MADHAFAGPKLRRPLLATQAAASRADGSRLSEYWRCYSWPELPSTARFLQPDATSVLIVPLIFMPTTEREWEKRGKKKEVSLDLHFLKQPPEVIVSFYSSRRLVWLECRIPWHGGKDPLWLFWQETNGLCQYVSVYGPKKACPPANSPLLPTEEEHIIAILFIATAANKEPFSPLASLECTPPPRTFFFYISPFNSRS